MPGVPRIPSLVLARCAPLLAPLCLASLVGLQPSSAAVADALPPRLASVAVGADGHEPMRLFELAWPGILGLTGCATVEVAESGQEVDVRLSVEPDGRPSHVEVLDAGGSGLGGDVAACVRAHVARFAFLAHGRDAPIRARLLVRFSLGSGQPRVGVVEASPSPGPLALLFAPTSGSPGGWESALGGAEELAALGALEGGSLAARGRGLGERGFSHGTGEGRADTPRVQVRASLSLGTTQGGLDPSIVRRVLARSRRQIEACYERWMADRDAVSEVETEAVLRIAADGRVSGVAVDRQQTGDAMADCISERLSTLRFPEAALETQTALRIDLRGEVLD